MRWSDDSSGTASHFAIAYRVASLGAFREPNESSWGHVMVFGTVPCANTLVRWEDENAFAPIVRARPDPTFGRPVRHRVAPSTTARYFSTCPSDSTSRWTPCPPVSGEAASGPPCRYPAFACVPHIGFSIPSSPRPARNYPRFRIRRPSSERRRDLNPPDHHAAQRTLWRLRRRP